MSNKVVQISAAREKALQGLPPELRPDSGRELFLRFPKESPTLTPISNGSGARSYGYGWYPEGSHLYMKLQDGQTTPTPGWRISEYFEGFEWREPPDGRTYFTSNSSNSSVVKTKAPVRGVDHAEPFEPPISFFPRAELLRITRGTPEIRISRTAAHKMHVLTDFTKDEVGWAGTVRREGDVFLIEDIFLLSQEASSTQTEITTDGWSELAMELMSQPDGMKILNSIRFWGHSHGMMGVSPSGQDNDQMLVFEENNNEWFIRGICNRKGIFSFSVYLYEENLAFHGVPWEVVEEDDLTDEEKSSIRKGLEGEFKLKVKYAPPSSSASCRVWTGGWQEWVDLFDEEELQQLELSLEEGVLQPPESEDLAPIAVTNPPYPR